MLNSPVARWTRSRSWARPLAIACYRGVDRALPDRAGPKVLVNSMPKAGTHLVMGVLDAAHFRYSGRHVPVSESDLIADGGAMAVRRLATALERTGRRHYTTAHALALPTIIGALSDQEVLTVTIVRDPRAVVASAVRYVESHAALPQRAELLRRCPTIPALADAFIDGFGEPGDDVYFVGIAERLRQFTGWLGVPRSMVIRFEDLVGVRGGGETDVQLAKVRELANFLDDMELRVRAHDVAERAFSSKSRTFMGGQIASWTDVLGPEQESRVAQLCQAEMRALGYLSGASDAPANS